MDDVRKLVAPIKLFEMIMAILITISFAVSGWTIKSVVDHGQKLAAIESNLFSVKDGLELWKQLAGIREMVAKFPSESPPKWFVDRVSSLEQRIEGMNSKTTANGEAIAKIQSTLDRGQRP